MNLLMKFRKSIMLVLKVLILMSVSFVFINCWQNNYQIALFSSKGNYVVILTYYLFLLLFGTLYGGFKIGTTRRNEVIYSIALSTFFTNILMYLVLSLVARVLLNPLALILATVLQLVVIFLEVHAADSIYYSLYKAHRIVAVTDGRDDKTHIINKMSRIKQRYNIGEVVLTDRPMPEILKIIDGYEAVLICNFEKSQQNEILRYCYANKKRIYFLPSSNDIIINSLHQAQVYDTPILVCRNNGLTIEQQIIKRTLDLLISGIGLIIFSPIFLLIALSIKLYDKGPVFFKQNRVTKDGKIFNVLKFRSMIVDADKVKLRKATSNDDRITPVGKVIRPLRLDELPQLLNILKGDMSFVGPRPERTENVYEYTKLLPEFDLRHRVKGGLTGYAQIYGKYNTSPQDKLNMDLIYIQHYSIFLDIKLVIMTLKILFMRESTEGFSDEDSQIGNIAGHVDAEPKDPPEPANENPVDDK